MRPEAIHSMLTAEETHWWYTVRRALIIDTLLSLADPNEPLTLADVGCGGGANTAAIRAALPAAKLIAIERDETLRSVALDRGLDARPGEAGEVPLANASCDVVTSFDVLEHVEDDLGALRESARVMAPGGVLVITVPALPSLWGAHDVQNEHVRRYTRSTLIDRMDAAGLQSTRCTYFNTLLLPLAIADRTLNRVTGRLTQGQNIPAAPLNSLLRTVFSAERPLIRAGVNMPIGLSLLAIAVHAEDTQ